MLTVLAIIVFLMIASWIDILAKKMNLPYTILLFMTGLFLIPIFLYVPGFWFLSEFQLTPDLLFYVFLPVLIFESGYNIKHQHLAKENTTIWVMATIWLLIAATVVWLWMHYILLLFNIYIPLEVTFLFWIIISATDPVAVLSIFKQLWTPHRLNLLFEWESLFNDWTAVAIFLVMLELFRHQVFTTWTILSWLATLSVMIIGGIILWIVSGIVFSKWIQYIKNNEAVEITMTMILAHLTFLLAEFISHYVEILGWDFKVSGVIATAFAAIIMGNYWRTKISPRVESYMEKFWNFFAFICNSLVFLLMWLMVKDMQVPVLELMIPLSVGIFTVVVWRAISIYLPIWFMNKFKLHEEIPMTWQHLLAWWSLRWALWLVLVLLIPDDFTLTNWYFDYSVKEFMLSVVIWAIMFSLIVKWLSMNALIKRLHLDQLRDLEEFERIELAIMVYQRIIDKINNMKEEYHICKRNYDQLKSKYEAKHDESVLEMQIYLKTHKNAGKLIHTALSLHALWIERKYLTEMFEYNECSEYIYMYLTWKMDRQQIRVENWEYQLTPIDIKKDKRRPWLERLINNLNKRKHKESDEYIIARTRFITATKVIESLEWLRKLDFAYEKKYIDKLIEMYKWFKKHAKHEMTDMTILKPYLIDEVNSVLLNKWLMKTEEKIVKDFWKNDMITSKLYKHFMNEVETEILKDIR